MKWIINQEDDPRLPNIANYLRKLQQPDGSWNQYPGADIDISATVKGYFALKLIGDHPDDPHMARARQQILDHGGAEKANSFSKFYLAALGQIKYSAVPTIPPEIVYLPKWFYFSLNHVSAWTRTMISPLSIVTTHKPIRQLTPQQSIDELYQCQKARHKLLPGPGAHRVWSKVFLFLDKLLKLIERTGITPLRKRALKRIEQWIVDHTENSDGLGAIFPPMVYIQIALRCRGYDADHEILTQAEKDLDALMIDDPQNNETRFQPCFSPIWDTGIAAYAMTEAGFDQNFQPLKRCADWLIAKECKQSGDWVDNVTSNVQPSGWYFEFNNAFYPDVDDTVMVAMALKQIGGDMATQAAQRGVAWIIAMQNKDGGWAAFDRTESRPILEHVPFADHNAIQDPSCADITGRTLECLGHLGFNINHPAVQNALRYLKASQENDGSWFGRWGVNYIYGTWQAVGGLQRLGVDMSEQWIQNAGDWLRSVQQQDGSFGETANSYIDISLKGTGPATPSQSAWGTMALLAIFGPQDKDVIRGIKYLCQTQNTDGSWTEEWFTGTGFPKVFYLSYHLYKQYFPIMALGRWQKQLNEIA